MKRLQKDFALPPAGRTIFLHSLVLLPAVTLLVWARGFARTAALIRRLGRDGPGNRGGLDPREVARLVDAAASLTRARCLPRSLVLWHLLRHRGASAEVRMGVCKLADDSLSAHAWLELDGLPLNDGADVCERYAVLPSLRVQGPS